MSSEDGLLDVELVAIDDLAKIAEVASPPEDMAAARTGRILWVVREGEIPSALEACDWGRELESGMIKHSNLTGGMPAHSGGELWVVKGEGILANANSGRYGAESPEELEAFVEALRSLGFRAASMGFDIDNPARPNSIQVGPVAWLDAHE
ncbi:MAG TPA: hypothetical protein VHW60_17310 [Caulobacteraceae bacterium]|nr:hypothetical protein [Caulobacteraceae bacterium]